jgi:hypothetical protein
MTAAAARLAVGLALGAVRLVQHHVAHQHHEAVGSLAPIHRLSRHEQPNSRRQTQQRAARSNNSTSPCRASALNESGSRNRHPEVETIVEERSVWIAFGAITGSAARPRSQRSAPRDAAPATIGIPRVGTIASTHRSPKRGSTMKTRTPLAAVAVVFAAACIPACASSDTNPEQPAAGSGGQNAGNNGSTGGSGAPAGEAGPVRAAREPWA